ncbi:MAG: diacylglycerol kinase [Paracoccaceae bacterium]
MPVFASNPLRKLGYSLDGVRSTWIDEASFRQWVCLVAVSDIASISLPLPTLSTGLIVALGFLVLAAELINTGLEAIVDKTSPETHALAKKAKDAGSAMSLLTFLALVSVWVGVLFGD